MEYLILIISSLYALTGIISIIGYVPTIRDLFKKKRSANFSSYLVWTFTSLVAFLYALFVIKDTLLNVVTGLSFFCCTFIMALSLRMK